MAQARRLILASTSRYRRELLERLGLAFEAASPHFDESPVPGETTAATALRLSVGKAESLVRTFPDALIIGADQVASSARRTAAIAAGGLSRRFQEFQRQSH